MSLAVDAALESLRDMDLSEDNVEELSIRLSRGELAAERNLSVITVHVETLDTQPVNQLLMELGMRFQQVIDSEFMLGGEDLHGYDGTLVVRREVRIE